MYDFSQDDIIIDATSSNVKESNHILRKLYNELNKISKFGWYCTPFREGNTIYVGDSTFGEMWICYKTKGCISKIAFRPKDEKYREIIKKAILTAVEDHATMQRYAIDVVFQTHNTHFIEMSRSNVLLFGDNNHLHVRFNLYAFGDFDLHYIATQKIHYLQMLLSVYTGNIYQLDNKCQVSHEQLENKNTEWDYDDDWIDSFCEQSGESAATLIPDFFDLFQLIIVEDCYSKNLRLVLNSIQDYYCALKTQQLIHSDSSYNIPGFVDSTNTLLISALEPLSCIGADSPETCPTCGNQVYKISERIRTLCTEYLGAELAKEIGRSGYGNRCSFLHEGNAKTNEFYCGVSVPLINPSLPNEIMNVSSCLEYNYFDYISYIIRKKIHDLLKSSLL